MTGRVADAASAPARSRPTRHAAVDHEFGSDLRPATDDMMMIDPPPARRIAGTACFTDRNTPVEVHCGLPSPVGQGHIDSPGHDSDPGVRHHDVETAKTPLGRFNNSRPALFKAHISVQKNRFATRDADLIDDGLTAAVVEVGNDDLCAFTRKRNRTRCTNPRRAARYDRNLVLDLS